MIYYDAVRGEDLHPAEREIFRYLGYQTALPDENTKKLTEQITNELSAVCTPKACFTIENPEPWCAVSQDLAKTLEHCETVLLFCATLGAGADRVLQKYSGIAPAKAVVAQAVGAAMIEYWCDLFMERLGKTLEKDGLYLCPRFSPGYGDFSMARQKNLLESVDAFRKIGVALTDSLLMTPTKSVSAVCGITKTKPDCKKHDCTSCSKTDCSFRRGT